MTANSAKSECLIWRSGALVGTQHIDGQERLSDLLAAFYGNNLGLHDNDKDPRLIFQISLAQISAHSDDYGLSWFPPRTMSQHSTLSLDLSLPHHF